MEEKGSGKKGGEKEKKVKEKKKNKKEQYRHFITPIQLVDPFPKCFSKQFQLHLRSRSTKKSKLFFKKPEPCQTGCHTVIVRTVAQDKHPFDSAG